MARKLALRLLAYEGVEGENSGLTEPAASRVYEKLRRTLCALAGVAGFRSLVSRALMLAAAEVPSLSAVQVTEEGSLQWGGLFDTQIDNNQTGEAGVVLIAQLLGLLLTFIGEALTMRLVQDAWPDAAFDDGDSGDVRTV